MRYWTAAAPALLLLAPALAMAASALDGNWMVVKADKSLDPSSMLSFKVERKTVSMAAPGGLAYTAKLDGSDTQITDDPNVTSISVKMPAKNVLVETARSGGKPWQTTTYEVAPGGNGVQVTWKNHKTNKSGSYSMAKQ